MSNQKEQIQLKVISYIITGIFLASLIPLFLIGIYNFPSSDDFSMGMAASLVWQQTHSVFATIMEAFRETGRFYMGWTGTFSTSFLMALCPAVFGTKMYVIVSFLMIGLLSFSLWYFIQTVLVLKLHADKHLSNIISILVLLFTIQGMPSPVEGFYWYTGAVHYIFPHSFLLLFFSILMRERQNATKRKRIMKMILLIFVGIFVGGGNYMTALLAILLFCLLIFKWVVLKEKENRVYLMPMAFAFVAFLANVLAPGNSVRQDVATGLDPLKAIYMSFIESFYFIWNYTFSLKTVCLLLLLLPFVWLLIKNTKFLFPFPIIVLILSYCLLSVVFTPCLYGVGNVDGGRLQDTIYITYLILLVTNMIYILGWICRKMKVNDGEKPMRVSGFVSVFFAGVSLLVIVVSIIYIRRDPNFYVTSSAINSLRSGQAAKYGEEGQERLAILLDQQQRDIVLRPFTDPPYLLYYEDITEDKDDWRNIGICDFYGKDSAILLKE